MNQPLQPVKPFLTDAEKYRWMRANRGHFAIFDALTRSDRDSDFDRTIETAMRLAEAGRHVVTAFDELAAH